LEGEVRIDSKEQKIIMKRNEVYFVFTQVRIVHSKQISFSKDLKYLNKHQLFHWLVQTLKKEKKFLLHYNPFRYDMKKKGRIQEKKNPFWFLSSLPVMWTIKRTYLNDYVRFFYFISHFFLFIESNARILLTYNFLFKIHSMWNYILVTEILKKK